MFKLNKVDEEILSILKETFLAKNIRPLTSDHHMRIWLIRMFFAVTIFGLLTRVILRFQEEKISTEFSSLLSLPITFFFGTLFLHINNESENTSLIVFVITWVSIVIALYI